MTKLHKFFLCLLVLLMVARPAGCTHEIHYKVGETIASSEKGEISSDKLNNIPGYRGDNLPETNYHERSESISGDAMHKQSSSEEGGVLLETQAKRQHFEIDSTTDPLFVTANNIVAKPEEALKVRVEEGAPQLPITETHRCYESREVETHKCTLQRFIKLKPIEDTKYIINVKSSRSAFDTSYVYFNVLEDTVKSDYSARVTRNGPDFPKELISRVKRCRVLSGPYSLVSERHIKYGPPVGWEDKHEVGAVEVIYSPNPTEADLIETIEDSCAGLEMATETGSCTYGIETIFEGTTTKNFDGLEVRRDWWHKERTYLCNYPSKNDCEPLRARGCFQTSSRCSVERAGKCVEFEQTYTCVKYPSSFNKVTTKGTAPFCLSGDCVTQSWNPNQDMAEVMAKLSMLKELKQEMDVTKTGRIFHGIALACSKHCISFSDCCGLGSGWGESLGLTHCSESEKLLSQKRQEHKCHQVGTYCAEKGPLGIGCLRKKTTFCCFGSRLARTIHEQGRAQLGIGWGNPEGPDCRPFSLEEFSRIDFKRINFSEIFSEVWSKIKVPDAGKIVDQFQKDWSKRLPTNEEIKARKRPTIDEVKSRTHPDSHEMQGKVSERRTQVSSALPVGSYSLNGNPPPKGEREEQTAEVMF